MVYSFNTPEEILAYITETNNRWAAYKEGGYRTFLPILLPDIAPDNWFLVKLYPLARTAKWEISVPIDLFYGKLHQIKYAENDFAYLIQLPKNLKIDINVEYLSAIPVNTLVEDLENKSTVIVQTPNLAVFVLDKTAQILVLSNSRIHQGYDR